MQLFKFKKLHGSWRGEQLIQPFNSQDFTSNSPYCLPYNSCDASLENL